MDAENAPSPGPPPVPQRFDRVAPGTLCRRCSYDLANLPPSGLCPECGKPIEESLRGDLLIYADAEYLSKIRLGVRVILACILVTVILTAGMLVATIAMAVAGLGTLPRPAEYVMGMANLLVSIASIYGYFMFSTPDPGVDPANKGDRPRQVLRIAIIAQAVVTPMATVGQMLIPIAPGGAMTGGFLAPIMIAQVALGLVSVAAWAAQFFASMRYMRWLAPRVPDARLFQQARTYQWVLPLWYIPGSCIAIGPIVALVLYYNFFNDLRKHLDRIAPFVGSSQPYDAPPAAPDS